MLLQKEIAMEYDQVTRLNLKFSRNFTRIAHGVVNEKSTNGFTKYFRQFKRNIERNGNGRKYIFIFSVKEYTQKREQLRTANGKVIVIDNTETTLLADTELFESGELGDLIDNNQFIVKDFPVNFEDKYMILHGTSKNIGYLTEITVKENGHFFKEIRLAYKNRLKELAQMHYLFIDKEMLEYAGMELVTRDESEVDPSNKDSIVALKAGMNEFEVLDVSEWCPETVKALLLDKEYLNIYANCDSALEYADLTKLFIADTTKFGTTEALSGYDQDEVAKLLIDLGRKAKRVEFIGKLWYRELILQHCEVYAWTPAVENEDDENADKLYVAFVIFAGNTTATQTTNNSMAGATYELTMLDHQTTRFSLRVVDNVGLSPSDVSLMITPMFEKMSLVLKTYGLYENVILK